jgi:hypothetical protein
MRRPRPAIEKNIHQYLLNSMALYRKLSIEEQGFVQRFTDRFCSGVDFRFSKHYEPTIEITWLAGAHAALIGGAQKTNCFSSVKWVYFDSPDDMPDQDGATHGYTTVRLNYDDLVAESKEVVPGSQIALHEFSHVLDFDFNISLRDALFLNEYKQNRERLERGEEFIIFDDHGNEYEFFAYATESYFTEPDALNSHYPKLYDWFKALYGLDFRYRQCS